MNLPRVTVTVGAPAADRWSVEVRTEGGLVRAPYDMAAGEVALDGAVVRFPGPPGVGSAALLGRLAEGAADAHDVTGYGRLLFDGLLGPAWPEIKNLREVQEARGVEIALDWAVDDHDLHRPLWEAMHDGTAPLAGHPDLLVPIVRLVRSPQPAPECPSRALKVLFALGSPLADEVIRPGAMFMGLLRKLDAEGLCVTRTAQHVRVEDLAEECARFRPDIVHLVAHGGLDEEGRGVVELGRGRPGGGPVRGDRLRTALTAGGRPQTVILNSCHSGASGPGHIPLAIELVAGGIPIVSAMAGEVAEPACRLYTRNLVRALHGGEPVAEALAKGRRAALLRTEDPAAQMDWAMPALFLSEAVPAGFRAVDPAPAQRLVEIADRLNLRKDPVYVGRREIFELTDEMVGPDPERRLGFVCAVGAGSLQGLGSTRLLRETGFRLLRTGHVPLLLGPYDAYGSPITLRTVLVGVCTAAVDVAEALGTAPPQLSVLGADPAFDASPVAATALADTDPADATMDILRTLSGFAEGSGALDPAIVRRLLAADLDRLAERLGGAGEPFGDHTRIVLLADSLHTWSDALPGLLAMVGRHGLGTSRRPAPLVATSSLTEGGGPVIKTFSEEHVRGFRFPPLDRLPDDEATLGFQWVLLHPWQLDRDPEYQKVYVSARGTPLERVHAHLRLLKGIPTKVEDELYTIAQSLWLESRFLADDDEAAYRAYLERHE